MTSLGWWELLNYFLVGNWLVATACGVTTLGVFLTRKQVLSPKLVLHLAYGMSLAIFVVPFLVEQMPSAALMRPTVQVWSKPRASEVDSETQWTVEILGQTAQLKTASQPAESIHLILLLVVLLGVGFWFRHQWLALREVQSSHAIKRIGRVEFRVGQRAVPASWWTPFRAVVLMPESFLMDKALLGASMRHEIQHHRQRDTVWVQYLSFLRSIFFYNPLVDLWMRQISFLQEVVCDDVTRKHVGTREYARCLVHAAAYARPTHLLAMANGRSLELLKRRLIMLQVVSPKNSRSIGRFLLALSFCSGALLLSAFSAKGWVVDQRISSDEDHKMLEKASVGATVPLQVNASVLTWINWLAGSQAGRVYSRETAERMKEHLPVIETILRKHGLPMELTAIPFAESGFENKANPEHKSLHGGGLWMFIPQTARRYGLRVDKQVDERLDVAKETEAAAKYLTDLYAQFKDWRLAILAYNAGEYAVVRGMKKTGAKEAWDLIARGVENDKDYLPKVVASAIVLKNLDRLQ